jgi:16S rRNA (guanine1207-N2)-methyltransferase
MSSPELPYYRIHELALEVANETIHIVTKAGFPDWDGLSPAALLLAAHVAGPPDAKILLLNAGHGALGVLLARRAPSGAVYLCDDNYVAQTMAERTVLANGAANVHVWPEPTVPPAYRQGLDLVALPLPKGRKLARRLLVQAQEALRTEGQLYMAGANDQGVQSVIKDAEELFGSARVLGYKKGNRVALAVKRLPHDPPAWASEPGIAPGSWYEFAAEVRGSPYRFRSLPGVFSYDRVDPGTTLLLSTLQIAPKSRVLDMGCGYGIIGLAAARAGAAAVDLVDADLLAVASAGENIAGNAIVNARALPSDIFSAVRGETYDLIASNPPFHVGQAVDYDVAHAFIADARQALRLGGQLVIVANRFIRYEQVMRGVFSKVQVSAQTGQYSVLSATR